ncbi:MAG: S8 family serine peptidase [Pseudomonadota bacterium]|nr:S8 family serine peptidase [Pseudomonadota bacterium]
MELGIKQSKIISSEKMQVPGDQNRPFHSHRLALGCAVALATVSGAVAAQNLDLERRALELVAERESVSMDELHVLSTASASFELQQRGYHGYKIESTKDGAIYAIALDDAAEQVVPAELEDTERVLYEQKYARMDRNLAALVDSFPASERIPVVFWLDPVRELTLRRKEFTSVEQPTEGELSAPEDDTEAVREVDALYAQLDAENADIAEASTAELTSRLANLGYEPVADTQAPIISAVVPAGELRELSLSEGVSQVYIDEEYKPLLSIAGNTIGAYQTHMVGNTGQNVRTALVEVGGTIQSGNPSLVGVALEWPNPGCSSGHATAVAGVIRSHHPFQRGIARNAHLWSGGACMGLQSLLQTSSNRAVNWGARAINLSFGGSISNSPGSFDRFYDNIVQNKWRTVVVAAGNTGLGNRVLNPSQAYNVIAVGAFNDRVWPWAMAGFSSSGDPVSQHGDREKPEVVAPGVDIVTTLGTGLTSPAGVDGTSFAAPMVTGAAALTMRRNSWLQIWPESVKSILMATATTNLEGAARLSEHDGAGGINANFADQVAGHANGTWGGAYYSCWSPTQWVVSSVYVQAGRRVRVAMAWNANPVAFNYSSRPGADLDMRILGPNNAVVASSMSWDNTYEIVDFVAPSSGTYKLRVQKYSCQYSPKWLGWSWALML